MRVHEEDDRPPMESTSTSSTARRLATSGCLPSHLSRPASAASLLGEFATTTRGIFVRRAFAVDLACEGATRRGSPSILRKRGHRRRRGPRPRLLPQARTIDACKWITELREALKHCEYGKVSGLAIGNLVPVKPRTRASTSVQDDKDDPSV
jgi:hypothetical protein